MNTHVDYQESGDGDWVPVFIPGARCLMDQEISDLPELQRKAVESQEGKGVWLKVHCPDRNCLTDDAKVILPAMGVAHPDKKSLWMRVFCPQDRCFMDDYTDLP